MYLPALYAVNIQRFLGKGPEDGALQKFFLKQSLLRNFLQIEIKENF